MVCLKRHVSRCLTIEAKVRCRWKASCKCHCCGTVTMYNLESPRCCGDKRRIVDTNAVHVYDTTSTMHAQLNMTCAARVSLGYLLVSFCFCCNCFALQVAHCVEWHVSLLPNSNRCLVAEQRGVWQFTVIVISYTKFRKSTALYRAVWSPICNGVVTQDTMHQRNVCCS